MSINAPGEITVGASVSNLLETFKSQLPDGKELLRDEHGCYKSSPDAACKKSFIVRVFDGDLSQTK